MDYKSFRLGHVATICLGDCYSPGNDPLAKELIEWISGEPASEFAWFNSDEPTSRVYICKEWIYQNIDTEVKEAIEVLDRSSAEELKSGLFDALLDHEVSIPAHPSFPAPVWSFEA